MDKYIPDGAQHVPGKKYEGKNIGCNYKSDQNPFLKYIKETEKRLKEDKIEFYENGIRTLNPNKNNSRLEYTVITKNTKTGKTKINKLSNNPNSNFIIFNPKT